ncbi:MAG: hypothetical protein LUQ22_07350 [Methanotrichaceae archaeon]|nr:hypothetical protein [Methanotrichaceae archaeon]
MYVSARPHRDVAAVVVVDAVIRSSCTSYRRWLRSCPMSGTTPRRPPSSPG